VAATAFELIEHLENPGVFLSRCSDLLPPGALLILSSLMWDGFDLQVLREKSNSINPPHHINFFTKKGIRILLADNRFELLEFSTPGKLDVDHVSKKVAELEESFIKKIVLSDEPTKQAFQKFLQDVGLSSHMFVVARRMTDPL
jgi:hypothetical protein